MGDEAKTPDHGAASAGVEALIERLRKEGVDDGRAQAEKIVADAQHRADWVIKQAEKEADETVAKARATAEQMKSAGEDALRIAARDAVLAMKGTLMQRFSREVERLVGKAMADETFVQRLILEVAGRVRQEAEIDVQDHIEILLPSAVMGVEELRRKPEELKEGSLSHFMLTIAGELLREGVTFHAADDISDGIKIVLEDDGVEIELSDASVAAVLLEHLQPRFRAYLEGIVK